MSQAAEPALIQSLIDNDLYKLTMGQVAQSFDKAVAHYRFYNRDRRAFPPGFARRLAYQVERMADLALTPAEYDWLRINTPWLKRSYLQWLRQFRFDPKQVSIRQEGEAVEIEIDGPWFEAVYWEVPLLSLVSELYFQETHPAAGWEERIAAKAQKMADAGVSWIDFGTRRRFNFTAQDAVNRLMKPFAPRFRGTSNPYFAMKHGLVPHGTYAHELPMAMQGRYGCRMCNIAAMDAWVRDYHGDLGIALTDTITTDAFLRDFSTYYAKLFDGVRLDSGDPFAVGDKIITHYEKLKIDPRSKVLVFSDGLNADKAIALQKHFQDRIRVTAGIGTFLTNDVGHKPLNIVIKLVAVDFGDGPVGLVKLSDDAGKYTGEAGDIQAALRLIGDKRNPPG